MTPPTEENRWTAPEDQFATQIQLADVSGFFSKKLVVEPGTRALMIEEGQYLGEVPPGTYTLESLSERLRPWRRKQATVVLTRQEEIPMDFACEDLPTAENLVVAINVRLSVQMEDVAMFMRNLLGTRDGFSLAELRGAVAPLVRQALWEAVGRMSITELTGPQVRSDLEAAVEQALGISMRRYGLRFGQVSTVSIRHDRYDEQRRKLGEAWLLKGEIEQRKGLDEIYSEEELRRIHQQERTNELQLLAQQVADDRMEGDVAAKVRRIGIRNKLREAVLSERFDEIKNDQEMASMIQEQDKAKLLREQEKDELVALFRDKQEDREAARRQLVHKLEIERTAELEEARADLDHASKVKTLTHEMELARRVEAEDNRRWLDSLQKESQQAEHRRGEKDKEIYQQRKWANEEALNCHEQQWQALLHEQRTDRVRGDVQVTQTERQVRIERMKHEFEKVQREDRLHAEQQDAAVRKEIDDGTFDSQIKKLEALERLDQESERARQELQQRNLRLESELNELGQDKASQRELARLQAVKDLGVEALIATADADRAKDLTDLEKHRASEQTKQVTSEAVAKEKEAAAKALTEQQEAAKAEQARLLEKLSDSAESKADAIVQAYKDAMAAQQQTTQQAFSAMGQAGQANVHIVQPGAHPVVPGQTPAAGAHGEAADQAPKRVLLCPQCRTENEEAARHCKSCGHKL